MTQTRKVNLETVKAATRFAGLTQQKLAAILDLNQTSIQNRLAGRTAWKAEELATVADLCKVPLDAFFSDDGLQLAGWRGWQDSNLRPKVEKSRSEAQIATVHQLPERDISHLSLKLTG